MYGRVFIIFALTAFSFLSHANKAAVLTIRKVRAPIYRKASFDSKIIAYAPKGKKLYGTKTARPGIEGFGLFHKVRLKKGVYGYILDTDIVGFKKQPPPQSRIKNQKKNSKKSKKKIRSSKRRSAKSADRGGSPTSRMDKWRGYPLSFVKAAGASIGTTDYTIEFGGEDLSSNETNFGLKLSGPGWLFKSLPLDFTFLIHFGGVGSLDSVTQGSSSGLYALGDITFPFRLRNGKNWSIYGGVGLLLSYSDFSFTLSNEERSSSALNVGAVGTLGLVYNLNSWLFKIEPKFYAEKSQYFGVLASFQRVL